MTSFPRSTTSAPAFVAGDRVAVLVFLAPELYFFFLSAFDASFTHLQVVLDLSVRELSVLPEYDVEAQTEYAERNQHQSGNEYFHIKTNKIPSGGIPS